MIYFYFIREVISWRAAANRQWRRVFAHQSCRCCSVDTDGFLDTKEQDLWEGEAPHTSWSSSLVRPSIEAFVPPFITSLLHQRESFLPQPSTLWYRAKSIDFHFSHLFSYSTAPSEVPLRRKWQNVAEVVWGQQAHRWQSYLFGPEQGHVLTAGPVPSPLFLKEPHRAVGNDCQDDEMSVCSVIMSCQSVASGPWFGPQSPDPHTEKWILCLLVQHSGCCSY